MCVSHMRMYVYVYVSHILRILAHGVCVCVRVNVCVLACVMQTNKAVRNLNPKP
jgi:hypothetical protein